MKVCKIKGCNKKHIALGFCPMHYARFKGYNKIKLNEPNKHPHNGEGWHIDKDGYKQIIFNGKYRREHRVIMENSICRKLLSEELVHHINGNILDNRIENLEIMSFAEHAKKHNQTIPLLKKQKALELYKQGIAMTKIPNLIKGISYSVIYWFIKQSGYPIRGIYNRNLRKDVI